MATDEEFNRAVEAVEEGRIDYAESKLFQAIANGESWAICFFMKCKAKHRGYVEVQRIEQAILGQVNHNHTHTVQFDYDKLDRDELENLRKLIQKAEVKKLTNDGDGS